MKELLWPAVNLAILVSILVYYLRSPLTAFVSGRHATLRDELQRVRELLRAAKTQFEEFSAKLKAIDAEVAALREQARQDAQASKLRLMSDAQKVYAAVVSDARAAADGLYSELKGQLYGELAGQVLDRAEKLMQERLTGDDRARIRQEFSVQVERAQ